MTSIGNDEANGLNQDLNSYRRRFVFHRDFVDHGSSGAGITSGTSRDETYFNAQLLFENEVPEPVSGLLVIIGLLSLFVIHRTRVG